MPPTFAVVVVGVGAFVIEVVPAVFCARSACGGCGDGVLCRVWFVGSGLVVCCGVVCVRMCALCGVTSCVVGGVCCGVCCVLLFVWCVVCGGVCVWCCVVWCVLCVLYVVCGWLCVCVVGVWV